jgi:hypothetical protein
LLTCLPFLYGRAGPPGLRTWLDKPFLYGHAGPQF